MSGIVEICCQSYEDALVCKEAGADQIELNSSLYLGGLTPSLGVYKKIKRDIDLPIMVMIRPRAAGFSYSEYEYETMLEDIEIFLEEGVDGIVFGFLNEDFEIDLRRTEEVVGLVKSFNREAVFHRAFDQVRDPVRSIEDLIDLGVDRILTSGQRSRAIEGLDLLGFLNRNYGADIEILVGSGINYSLVDEIYNKTGIKKFHGSCKCYREDRTSSGNISYSYLEDDYQNSYELTNRTLVEKLVREVKCL